MIENRSFSGGLRNCKSVRVVTVFHRAVRSFEIRFEFESLLSIPFKSDGPFLPARRYASAGYSDRNVSVRLSVRHAPVLCQNEES